MTQPTPLALDTRMTARTVAKHLGVSIRRVHQLALPKVRLGDRTVRYRTRDVQAFIDTNVGLD